MKRLDPLSGDEMTPEAPGRDLEALFERARGDGLTAGETDELWARVGAAIATPGAPRVPHGATGSGAGATATIGTGAKVIAAIAVAGGLVAGGIAYRERAPAPPPVITLRPTHIEASRPADSTVPAPAVSVDDLPRAADPVAASGKSRPSVDRRDFPRGPSARAEIGESSSAPLDSTLAARSTINAAQSPADSPALADHPSPSNVPQTVAADPGPTEGSLLLRARQELSSDPSDALALTLEHGRRFPSGTLVQEREVLAIEALARLGRIGEARRRLDAFRSRFPQSPHVARLTTLVGP